jgi:hypothetical protein
VPCISDRSKEVLSITINLSLFLQMPYQKTPHILYRIHIWTTTGSVEDVYILDPDPGTMLLPYETYARSSCPAER